MLEIGENNFIEDKDYLKNYDLVDIPGLSEFIKTKNDNYKSYKRYTTIEKEMEDYNPENEENYLTKIFTIIKNKIDNGVILFSIDNYQLIESYRIIGKLQKVIDRPIENFLILLNKIDLSENKDSDLKILKNKMMEYFPNGEFNFINNKIIPCCLFQLENELKMDKNFKNLIHYHYLNFLMNAKNNNILNRSFNFIDYLKKIISQKTITKKYFIKKINEVFDNLSIYKIIKEIQEIINYIKGNHLSEDLNFGLASQDLEILQIRKNLKAIKGEDLEEDEKDEKNEEEEDNNYEEEEEFDIEEQKGNLIMLYYYSEFKNKKLIPSKTRDTLDIINFFSLQNIYNFNKNKAMHSPFFINDTQKFIYIPLLGVSNAGKSTLLNCIIGTNLLPNQRTECTKKGILIKYWDNNYPAIRKTKLYINKKTYKKNIYEFKSDEKILATNVKDIREILEGINGKFMEDEEDFFYEIDIKIKLVDESDIDNNLKKSICFIDLPGIGTNNIFEEKNIYSNLLLSCETFIFVFNNLNVKEKTNITTLINLYKNIPNDLFFNNCLFVFNFDSSIEYSENYLLQAKEDLISIIQNQNYIDKFNICFLNSKYYEIYLNKYNYYQSLKNLVDSEFNIYSNLKENLWKNKIAKIKGNTFNKYILEKLKEKIKNEIDNKYDDNIIIPNNIYEKDIKTIKENKNFSLKKEELEQIVKYLAFANFHLKTSSLLNKSNYLNFEKNIISYLKNIKRNDDHDFDLFTLNVINDINLMIPADIKYLEDNFLVKLYKLLSFEKDDETNNNYNNITIELNNNNIMYDIQNLNSEKLSIKNINIEYIDNFKLSQKQTYDIIDKVFDFCENLFEKKELSEEFYELLSSNLDYDKKLLYSFHIFENSLYENSFNDNLSQDSFEFENTYFLSELNNFINILNKKKNYCFNCNKIFYINNEAKTEKEEEEEEYKYCKYCQEIVGKQVDYLPILTDLKDTIEDFYNYIIRNNVFYIGIFYSLDADRPIIYNKIFDINIKFNKKYSNNRIIIEEGNDYVLYKAELEILDSKGKKFYNFKRLNKIISGKKNVEKTIDLFLQ